MADADPDFVNVTDQDTLSAEESALLAEMEAGDKADTTTALPPDTKTADKPDATHGSGEKKDAPEAGADPSKTVPLAALQESRAEAKRLREERLEDQKRFNLLEQRTNTLLERLTKPAEEEKKTTEEVIPDYETDPAGHIAGLLKKQGLTVEQLLAKDKEREQQTEAQKTVQGIFTQAIAKETEFEKATPDYRAASDYMLQSRHDELEDMGYTDKAQREQIIANEKLILAQKALAEGRNPAEVVYKMAQRRGYKKAEAAKTDDVPAKDPITETAAKNAAERLKNIESGSKTSASLSDVGGQGPVPMTAARLMEMSDSEFEDYSRKHPKEFKNLMGS